MWRRIRLRSLVQNPGSSKTLKGTFSFDVSRYSNSSISVTMGLFFFHQNLNQKANVCKERLDRKTVDFDPCIRFLIVLKSQNVLLVLISRYSNLDFSVFTSVIFCISFSINGITFAGSSKGKSWTSILHQNPFSLKLPF